MNRFGKLTIPLRLAPLVAALWAGQAPAEGLAHLYADARSYDAQFAAARSAFEAAETLPGQALGQMLPQLGLNGSRVRNQTENEIRATLTGKPVTRDYDFISKNASLNLSQALLRPQLWASYAQSKAQVRQAEAQFHSASQDLAVRLSQAYFDVLLAQDNVKLAAEQKAAITEQLQQAKRYFEAGVGTITDINEAQARYDTTLAQELAAQNTLEIRIRAVEQIVGKVHRQLDQLGPKLQLESPEPSDVDRWIEVALENSPAVRAGEAALDAAQQDVYRSMAAHLPTLDLVASRGKNENPSYTTIDTTATTNTIGLQFSMPLFAGGSTQGRVNQSSALRDKARNDLENARRATILATRQEYLNVINGIAQVKALEQAVKSNELALYSARKGQEAGLRTSFDVLNAQQLLFSAKRDLAQARYNYVLARLKLRAAAGLLNEDDITLVQTWLNT